MKQPLRFDSDSLYKVLDIFKKNNANVRIIGGAVRDNLIFQEYSDIDLATTLLPKEVTTIFEQDGFTVIPTGIDFGTVTVIVDREEFQITTLRKDIKTDGRHAIVEYTNDYKVDASRRDFTINALSYDPFSKNLYDYFNGLNDLKNSIVRFIGAPIERITEDHLRIMRFFRFSAYYASSLNKDGLDACKTYNYLLNKISSERINQELSKLLMCKKNISNIILEMENCSLFMIIFKEIVIDPKTLILFEEKISTIAHIGFDIKTLRFALLIAKNTIQATKKCLKNLRFSNDEIKSNAILHNFIIEISKHEDKKSIFFEICKNWYYNHNHCKLVLILAYLYDKISINELETNIVTIQNKAPKMPIKSAELISKGYTGLSLGIRIKFLEKKWIESGFSATVDELENAKFYS